MVYLARLHWCKSNAGDQLILFHDALQRKRNSYCSVRVRTRKTDSSRAFLGIVEHWRLVCWHNARNGLPHTLRLSIRPRKLRQSTQGSNSAIPHPGQPKSPELYSCKVDWLRRDWENSPCLSSRQANADWRLHQVLQRNVWTIGAERHKPPTANLYWTLALHRIGVGVIHRKRWDNRIFVQTCKTLLESTRKLVHSVLAALFETNDARLSEKPIRIFRVRGWV